MITCKDFLRELNEYLDETADVSMKKELELHVSQCPNCFVVVDTTKQTLRVFKGMEPQEIPSTVQTRLMEALQRRMNSRRATGTAPE
ncbi:MAG: zf-HC2 domain-containing protein [Bryobacteraceae bacterium]|nr:zf-HC2 domain-containing protein [Bryobacteraceae bacterium]